MEESVRHAVQSDHPVLQMLVEAARSELPDKKGGDVIHRLDKYSVDPVVRALEAIEDPSATVLLGAIDGTPVGYGLMTVGKVVDGTLHAVVEELYVDPGARAVGVGEVLIEALMADARSRGAIAIQSLALPGDRATKNFFESQGMVARSIMVHRWLDGR
ncbi:MAG: GNAT family N-acetyltransferase [Acidimicrobiales bacterium]|nr:GNAT family N-acetyltransferase [Acidimicrobiales bacterium]